MNLAALELARITDSDERTNAFSASRHHKYRGPDRTNMLNSSLREESKISAAIRKDSNIDHQVQPSTGQDATTLMQKSQSLATLLHHGMNTSKYGGEQNAAANNHNNFAVRSSSKTTEQMVRSI